MKNVTFLNPEFFWLFLLIPVAIAWLFWRRNKQTPTLKVSSLKGFQSTNSILVKLHPFLHVLRLLALSS